MKALLQNSLCTIPAVREPGLPARRPHPGLCTAATSGREEGRFQLHLVGTPLPSARVAKGWTAGHWLAVCWADASSLDLSPVAVQHSTLKALHGHCPPSTGLLLLPQPMSIGSFWAFPSPLQLTRALCWVTALHLSPHLPLPRRQCPVTTWSLGHRAVDGCA